MSASTHTALPEQFGPYRILQPLGKGGMGSVYLAHDTRLDRTVALKVAHQPTDGNPEVLQRLQREASAAATLNHPNLCPVFDIGVIDNIHYLAMAYIEGPTLAEWHKSSRPLPPKKTAALIAKLALAMQEAHKAGILHRDLKPANIKINARHEPIILDFGLARRTGGGEVRLTRTGAILGTPAYMAPEQVLGQKRTIGPGCDIYALGVVLYELVTGRLPFEGDEVMVVLLQITQDPPPPPSTFRPDLDPRLEAICLKALAKKPEERFDTMAELAQALIAYLRSDKTAQAKPSGTPKETISEPPVRRPSVPQRTQGKGKPGPEPAPPAHAETASEEDLRGLDSPTWVRSRPGRRRGLLLMGGTIGLLGLSALVVWITVSTGGTRTPPPDDKKPDPPPGLAALRLQPVEEVTLQAGQTKKVTIRVERQNCPGPVGLQLEEVPAGVSAKPVTMAAGSDAAELELRAGPETAESHTNVRLVAVVGEVRTEGQIRLTVVTAPPPAKPGEKEIVNSIGMKLVLIPPGKFVMGSPKTEHNDEDEGQHEVEISRPYYLGAYEVTQEEYLRVICVNRSHFSSSGQGKDQVMGLDTRRFPVESVDWVEAWEFCRMLTELPEEKKAGRVYRLPTEAEWEYACREAGRATSRFHFGAQASSDLANFRPGTGDPKGPFLGRPTQVGSHKPNALGLYDMHGNVSEWCQDWYDKEYWRTSPRVDPQGPNSGRSRVGRGGSWVEVSHVCRSASRRESSPGNHRGFRVLCLANAGYAGATNPPAGAAPVKGVVNSIGMELVLIPPGKFWMGSPKTEVGRVEAEEQHEVEITRRFYIGAYEVTQEEYQKVMGANPSYFASTGEGKNHVGSLDTRRFPVEGVSWEDAREFCRRLSELPEEKKAGRVYRLPTEAEWEYVCRGGDTSKDTQPYHFGAALSPDQANFVAPFTDRLRRTRPVGLCQEPNAFGVHDLHGNVSEWCQDWYDKDYYKNSPRQDPQGPQSGTERVLRGGHLGSGAESCRTAARGRYDPSKRSTAFGFRVVCVPAGAP